jgi:PAS domain S-box-containing protein
MIIEGDVSGSDAVKTVGIDLGALLKAGAIPITSIAPDGTVLSINEVGAANLGVSVEKVVGQPIYEFLPEMAELLRARFKEVMEAGESRSFEDEVELPDGKRVFQSIDAPIMDAGGKCLGVHVVSLDVTEHRSAERDLQAAAAQLKQAEEAVQQAERRFQLAMEAVRDGVWDWDVETGDYDLSPNFYALVGYTEDEIQEGRAEWFFGILHAEDRPRIQRLLEDHFKGLTEEYVAEYRWQHKNGSWRWAFSRGRVVEQTPDGSPKRMLGTTIDVTDRHELEARLLAAEKMEAIGRLAGGVAHDFNNLLTAVMGHLDFLGSYQLPREAKQDIAQISTAVGRASKLTSQLLSFARRRMVQPQAVEINPLLRDLHKLLTGLLQANIEIVFKLGDQLPRVFLDPAQLEQIVVNLSLNARDAMGDGGQLSFTTSVVDLDDEYRRSHPEVAPGPHVLLEVSDTGVGMDAETLDHVFEPFYTTKAVGEGTGLGLASCYGIVKQAGGHVTVESEPGRGSCFGVYLPAVQSEGMGVAVESSGTAPEVPKPTVLVVEDDDLVRATAVRALEQRGFRVLEAASGDQALALPALQNKTVDMLVTDVVMPGMTGRALAERLRARRPAMKVLYVSGYTADSVLRHGALPDGVEFLAKPFTPKTLGEKVAELLGIAEAR